MQSNQKCKPTKKKCGVSCCGCKVALLESFKPLKRLVLFPWSKAKSKQHTLDACSPKRATIILENYGLAGVASIVGHNISVKLLFILVELSVALKRS